MIKGYQVFEISPTGGSNSIFKVYPTWLERVRNRFAREHCYLVGYRYIVKQVP